ncbi:copper resistance protein B [Sphingomonas sp.]|uniref:copper resistance protein B n=1 Tax=Sphingomonas sp. TaxID=28214 RepID=UPI003D6C79B2
MKTLLLLAGASLVTVAVPARAQSMDQSMPGMTMPAKPAAKPKPRPKAPPAAKRPTPAKAAAPAPAASPDMPPMSMAMPQAAPAEDPHAGHVMPGMPAASPDAPAHGPGGTALPAGDASAPAASEANYADTVWGKDTMAASRRQLRREHGGGNFSQVMFNLAEYQVRDGRDGFRWDGEGWFGGDINRLVVKSEGSGSFGEGVEDAEIQALYSRAIGPYFNLQAGVRHDITPNPSRTYATIGFEGLAPYWFEVEGALFLSDKGDLLARVEGYYDQRITQRLVLQPRAELNFAAQDVPETGTGAGLSDVELGLRLRYEVTREFAPYIGVSWDRRLGDTARYARLAGENAGATSFVIGVRTWF